MTMSAVSYADIAEDDVSIVVDPNSSKVFAWFWQKNEAKEEATSEAPKAKASSEAKKKPPEDLTAPVARSIENPQIALLLPITGQYEIAAYAVMEGFISAYYVDAGNNANTDIRIYDTVEDKEVVKAYRRAVEEGANIVVGPLTKPGNETLIDSKVIDNKMIVISLNTLEGRNSLPRYLYPFSLGPEDEAFRLAEQAWHNGHKVGGALVEKTAFGRRAAASFKKRFEQLGGQIEKTVYFDKNQALEDPVQYLLNTEYENVNAPHYDFLFLMASPGQGRQVPPLLQFYNQHLPIYAMANIYTGTPNPGRDNDLNGVVFCDSPWVVHAHDRHATLNAMAVQLLTDPAAQERLFAFGIDAYKVAKNIRPLSANTSFSLPGVTGKLSMDASGFIVREPECVRFSTGVPRGL
jgi:outer membrane PBP1 activator LpoA protein